MAASLSTGAEGVVGPLYRRLVPEPLRARYRALVPAAWRTALRRTLPYEQDLVRAARFSLRPGRRRAALEALERCATLDDIFDFSADALGHQQIREEVLEFIRYAEEAKPARACEVGTAQGGTNLLLTRGLPSLSLMIAVDLHIWNRRQRRYFTRSTQSLVQVEGASCDRRTLAAVERALGPHKLDLLFIDADHSYEGVKQDFLCYRHLVRDGGMIAFHDIIPSHAVKLGIPESAWEGAQSGEVHLFWRKLKGSYVHREIVKNQDQDGCGIGVIEYTSRAALPHDL